VVPCRSRSATSRPRGVDRSLFHHAKQLGKVLGLEGQQLGERELARGDVARKDHFPHRGDTLFAEEHVLGTAQPDAFRAKGEVALVSPRLPNTIA
jgi:hypothetical protein